MLNVRIGGVTFEGSPVRGDDAFVISPDGWSGWDDGTAVRREAVERPGAHGSFGFRGFRDARVVTISGWIIASNMFKLQHMWQKLLGVLADGQSGRLTVERPDGTQWADVMLTDLPTVKVRGQSETEAEFTIQFWAPMPQKYGEVDDFAAGIEAVNRGNFPATPRLIVGAGSGGYTITGPGGRTIVVGASAPAGEHYIDFSQGGLFTAAGVRVPGAMTVFRPWTIGPGLPGVVASITGARSLVQRVTNTFI